MKSNRFIVALGVLLFLALACEKEPSLTLSSPPSLEFTGDGSTGTISFSANRDWTATTSEPWVTVTPSSGKASDGPAVITVNLSANDTYSDRAANVTITAEGLSQTVQIRQAANLGLVVPVKSFELACEATSFEVEVQSNVGYSVNISADWIKQTGTRGLKSDKLVFSVQENTSYDARSAKVDIKPSDPTVPYRSVSVKQAQKDAILLEDTSFDMPYGGGEIELKVQANVEYEVESTASWIQLTGTRSLNNTVVRLKVDENTTASSRQGSVTISQTGGNIKHTVTVKQGKKVAVTGIVLDKTRLEMLVDEYVVLTATVLPEDASDKTVTWSSDNEAVAVVGVIGDVIARSAGSATITARAGDKTATCLVLVEERIVQVPEVIEVPEEGGLVEVDIQYNVDYNVKPDQDWITFVQTRALSNGKLQFQVAPNDREDVRTASVMIDDKAMQMDPVFIQFKQASKMRRVLTEFYYAMDGPNWTEQGDWCSDKYFGDWKGVYTDGRKSGVLGLQLQSRGLKGSIPPVIGEFRDIKHVGIEDEPGVKGVLPDSFGNLVNLQYLSIGNTSMTALPDVFAGLTDLRQVFIYWNAQMSGPLPESIGSSPAMEHLAIYTNLFTGSVPSSWSRISSKLNLYNNCLTGKISYLFNNRDDLRAFLKNSNLFQKSGYGFDISDLDIPGYSQWIDGPVENSDGTLFTFDDVVSKNKYTVYVIWAPWCPYSRILMPSLKKYYETYRQDGLGIIGTCQVGDVDEYGAGHPLDDRDGYWKEVREKGYDQWYNFYWPDYGSSYLMSTPNAEVYDKDGYLLFSSFNKYPDPVRKRYGRQASSELIPFLEGLLGPATPPDPYSSKDYSKDGQVMTLQKATVGKGINIVFMGDAYTDRDMGNGGVYETAMKQAMEQFFAVEPYKTFRNRFNVYAVKVVSKNGRIGSGYTTALGTYFGNGTYVNGNNDKCFEYALKVPGINSRDNLLVNVLVNTGNFSGTAILFREDQSAVSRVSSLGNDPDAYGSTLQHESGGHGFAFLADEYAVNSGTPPQSHIDEYNEVYDKYGWFSNVDFTDNPDKIRWSTFLKDSRYDGRVGIYESAALYTKGAWRPTVNSIMNENMGEFNAPSRWAIYKQIMKRSGEDYSWEKFLEYDAVNRRSGVGSSGKTAQKAPGRHIERGAPPVIM